MAVNAVVNIANTTCACFNGGNGASGVGGQGGSVLAGAKGSGVLNGCSGGIGGGGGQVAVVVAERVAFPLGLSQKVGP